MTKQANIHEIQELILQNGPRKKRTVTKSNTIPLQLGAEVHIFQLEGLLLGLSEPVWLHC